MTQAGVSTLYVGSLASTVESGVNNLVQFTGIAVTDPAPIVAIAGVRVNANPAFVPAASGIAKVLGTVSSPDGSVTITQEPNGLPLGFVFPGVGSVLPVASPTASACAGTSTLLPGSAFAFSIIKNFPTAFKIQGLAGTPRAR
jgi:hypothetical protein